MIIPEPQPPARVTLPRSLVRALMLLLLAHLFDDWAPPFAVIARIVAVICVINYLYCSWRWSRYVASWLKDKDPRC